MSGLPAEFLAESGTSLGGKAPATVLLSFFGKFPAWTDFVNEFCPSRTLAAAEHLFREGLARTGTLPVDHDFIWARGRQSLLGSLWDSQDQSGRQFPAVACAHVVNVGMRVVATSLFDSILEFRTLCTALAAESGIKTHEASGSMQKSFRIEHASMQRRLVEILNRQGPPNETATEMAVEVDSFLDSPAVRSQPGGFSALLSMVLGELSEFGPLTYRADNSGGRPAAKIRVPSGNLESRDALFFWWRVLQRQVHPDVPLLIVAPRISGWVDIIVGNPKPHELGCIRQSPDELKIQQGTGPFLESGNPLLADGVNRLIEALRSGKKIPKLAGKLIGSGRGAGSAHSHEQKHALKSRDAKPRRAAMIWVTASLAFAGIVALAGLWWINFKGTGDSGDANLLLSQPVDVVAVAGDRVVFSVKPSKTDGVAYSWVERSGNRIVGTSPTLRLEIGSDQVGRRFEYCLVAADSRTSETSRWASLTVNGPGTDPVQTSGPPEFTKNLPSQVNVAEGDDLRLGVEVSSPGAAVSWYFAGTKMLESISTNLLVRQFARRHSGPYWAVASGVGDSVTSAVTQVGFIPKAPQISTEFAALAVRRGEPATLSVSAPNAVSIEWMLRGTRIGTGSVHQFTPQGVADSGKYEAIARNESGRSNVTIDVTVIDDAKPAAPTFGALAKGSILTNVFGTFGGQLTLCVDRRPTGNLRWAKDGKPDGFPDSPCCTISNVNVESGGIYSAEMAGTTEPLREFRVWIEATNEIGMRFIWVPGLPGHQTGAWVGKFEVTQGEYEKVIGQNPSRQQVGSSYPVDSVNFDDANEFCRKISASAQKLAATANVAPKYSLLTETQWVYVARGTELVDSVTSYGRRTSRSGPEQVGTMNPNPQGLFDVRGNLWELTIADSPDGVVCRGGAYGDASERLGASEGALAMGKRYKVVDARLKTIGFRCLMSVD